MRKMSDGMTYILSRKDFISEGELKERYNEIKPLEKYGDMIKLKLLDENEKVKKFDDYIDSK